VVLILTVSQCCSRLMLALTAALCGALDVAPSAFGAAHHVSTMSKAAVESAAWKRSERSNAAFRGRRERARRRYSTEKW